MRRRKRPQRFEEGSEGYQYSPAELFRVQYYEILDHIIAGIKERFDSPGYQTFLQLETVLLSAANGQAYSLDQLSNYSDDMDFYLLQTQLQMLPSLFKGQAQSVTLVDVFRVFQSSSVAKQQLFSEVKKLVTLLLLLPATNAGSERAFSTLRRVKSYTRSTMLQSRLNHVMLAVTHRSLITDQLVQTVMKQFIQKTQQRMNLFSSP
jgi:hypothetical protein